MAFKEGMAYVQIYFFKFLINSKKGKEYEKLLQSMD